MNSSSAFSNVLSAAPILPKANPLSQKGGADDDSTTDFKRAFDDVRAEQDVKPKEPCAKKLTSTDKRSKAKSDDSAAADNTATSAEKPASKVAKKSTEKEKTEDTVASDDSKKTDTTDVEANVPVTVVLDLPAPVEPVVEDAPVAAATSIITDSVDSVQNTEAPTLVQETPVLTTENVSDASIVGDAVSPVTASTAEEAPQQEVDALLVNENKVATAVTDANKVATVTDVIADAATADVVATVSADALKSTEVKASGLATETASASEAGDDSTSAATTDLKAVFEKMLQAMSAGAGANSNTGDNSQGSREQNSNPVTSLNSTTSPASSTFDALARNIDAQSPATRSFVVQTSVPVPVGQPQWSQAVGEKVLWLAAQNVHSAEIRLDPPELGPMQVKISVNQEQTTVNFTSHHAGVREVLDQNLGRLRDMFNEQGLNLVNVDISDRSFQRHQGDGSEQQGQGGNRSNQEEEETPVAVSAIVQQRLVDHYA